MNNRRRSQVGSWQGRLSRRSLLRGAAAAGGGLAALSLVGCGDSESDDGSASGSSAGTASSTAVAPGEPQRGGNLRIARDSSITQPDPYRNASGAALPLYGAISDRLLDLNPQGGTLAPSLIAEWEEVETGLEYVFKLQPDAKWQDIAPTNGRPFDAEDVIHNIEYAAGLATPDDNANIARKSWYFGIANLEAVDDKTVRLRLSEPNAPILSAMAEQRQPITPREVMDGLDLTNFEKIPSIGPFVVSHYRDGESAMFERNPAYWRTPYPYVDTTEIKFFGDDQSARAAFFAGDIDIYRPNGASSVKEVQQASGTQLHIAPFRAQQVIFINTKRFSDARIWKAMHYLFDYQGTMDAVFGDGYWELTGPVNSALPGALTPADVSQLAGYNSATRDADIAEAKQLLDAAGYPGGDGLSFELTQSSASGPAFDLAVRFQAGLKQLVPDLRFELRPEEDAATFSQKVTRDREFDMVNYLLYEGPDVRIAALNYKTGGSRNYASYSDPKVDELIDRTYGESGEAMFETVAEIQTHLIEDGVPVIACGTINDTMATRENVHGLQERMGPGSSGAANLAQTERGYVWLS